MSNCKRLSLPPNSTFTDFSVLFHPDINKANNRNQHFISTQTPTPINKKPNSYYYTLTNTKEKDKTKISIIIIIISTHFVPPKNNK